MPPLVALKPHRYDGRLVRKGERYAAQSDSDATLLTAIGFSRHDVATVATKSVVAEPEPTPEPTPSPEPVQEPEPASPPEPVEEPEQTPVPTDPADPPKRRYRRKDMTATEG